MSLFPIKVEYPFKCWSINVKMPVFSRAEFYLASLSTKCKRVNVKCWSINVKMPVFSRAEFYLASLSTKCKRVNVKCLSINVKITVFSRAEFCSLSTKFEEVQYNIVMIGSKEEDFFFLFMPSLRKLHTRSLLGHGFVSFVAKKKKTCSIKIKLDQCNVAVVCMYFTWLYWLKDILSFRNKKVKLGQLEYTI